MAGYKVGYFVGSLATKSINRSLAQALVRLAPRELQMTEISFKDGVVNDESTRAFLQNYMAEFLGFITRVYTVLPRNERA